MLSLFRLAAIASTIVAISGAARAEDRAPVKTEVSIHKLSIDNGGAHSVKYYVAGGSPHLQALVRRIEWTENELNVIEQLQGLKLDNVVNERRVAALRTAQLTIPNSRPGFSQSINVVNRRGGAISLSVVLDGQLAYEATPESALQLIGLLEQSQTEMDAELKALPAKEPKAAEGAVDALRPRVAALSHHDAASAKARSFPATEAPPQALSSR